IRDDVGASLRVSEVVQHDDRYFRKAQLARGQQTTVASDDPGIAIDHDWRVESKFRDGGSDLRNLRFRGRARIPRVRHEATYWPDLDAAGQRGRNGSWVVLVEIERI